MAYKNNLQLKNVLIGVLAMGLVLILVSFFNQLNFSDNSRKIERGNKVELTVGDVLEQKFIAQHNNLSNIKILFGNRKLLDGSYLNFILADKNCKNNIFEKTLKGEYNLDSKYLYDFSFPKIDNSRGKEYCLKIELKTEKEWGLWRKIKGKIKPEKKPKIQKVRLFEQLNVRNEVKNYILLNSLGKVKSGGDRGIAFIQGYRNESVVESFQQLNQRMSQYKPWFLKGGYLTNIVIASIVLTGWSIIGLIYKIDK